MLPTTVISALLLCIIKNLFIPELNLNLVIEQTLIWPEPPWVEVCGTIPAVQMNQSQLCSNFRKLVNHVVFHVTKHDDVYLLLGTVVANLYKNLQR